MLSQIMEWGVRYHDPTLLTRHRIGAVRKSCGVVYTGRVEVSRLEVAVGRRRKLRGFERFLQLSQDVFAVRELAERLKGGETVSLGWDRNLTV